MGADLVAVVLPHGRPLVEVIRGVWDAGDAVAPLPDAWPDPLVAEVLAALRPARLVDAAGRRRLPDPVPVTAGTAAVVATSGTTGAPKGVVLSHAALTASAWASLDRLGAGPGDRFLLALPLSHVAGLQVLVRSALLGTDPLVVDPSNTDAIAAAAGGGEVQLASLVPTQLRQLLAASADLSPLSRLLLGGAAPPADLLADARAAGVRVTVTYGATETSGGCVYDGVPLDGVALRVDDRGRIALRGPVLMDGYRLRPDLSAQTLVDGWFVTADLGRLGPDGRLEVLGRADDVIVTGGLKVHAPTVAALLRRHPQVADAVVVGRPDSQWGQRVVARCVPADPADPPTLDALRAFVAARTDRRHAPTALELVDELPRTVLGEPRRA